MAKTIVAKIPDEFLQSGVKDSDRFVYSNYFVPLRITFDATTPLIPFYIKHQLLDRITYGGLSKDRVMAILEELKMPELWALNRLDEANEQLTKSRQANVAPGGPAYDARALAGGAETRAIPDIARDIRATAELLTRLEGSLDTTGREVLRVATGRLGDNAVDLLRDRGAAGRTANAPGLYRARPNVLDNRDVDTIAGLIETDMGYGFLDRTRISPVGFAIGEHVYALGLAPGEEVILEQKTFTKRQVSFEKQSEQETQFDIELSSTFSTELQEGFDDQNSKSDAWGLNVSHTGSYTSPPNVSGTWNASHTVGYTENATNASQEANRRSQRDAQQQSAKIAGRYRTQHKTIFRVSTEQGVEVSSKRTIRNPNRVAPITLHYFKVLQRLRLRQERYGVRLCWAPSIDNPALNFFGRIKAGKQRILDDAIASLPEQPVQPPGPGADGTTTVTREEKMFWSGPVEANQDNWTNGQSFDYEVDVIFLPGWSWDGEASNIRVDLTATQRTPQTFDVRRVGNPVTLGGKVRVIVHVDADNLAGALPIVFQVGAKGVKEQTIAANSGQDAGYQAALVDWRARLGEWETLRDEAVAEASEAAGAFEKDMLTNLSPVNEIIAQIIQRDIYAPMRDDPREIEYWQRLFEWERASFRTFPSWWSSQALRDPTRDPSDFVNASWATLYLPVRIGMEKQALRWLYNKTMSAILHPVIEERLDAIVADLKAYRKEVLGAEEEISLSDEPCQPAPENFRCLAEWTEVMPTDGTHIEVVLGATSAADDVTTAELKSAQALREALLETEKSNAQLKVKARELVKEPAKVVISIGDGGVVESET